MALFGGLFRTRISAVKLAEALFTYTKNDAETFLRDHSERYAEQVTFHVANFEKQVFLYSAANVAVALTVAYKSDSAIASVIVAFREKVHREMGIRWGYSDEEAGDAVESTASNLAALIFANPTVNQAHTFEWSQNWLKNSGVEEFNPAQLFLIGMTWKNSFISIMRVLSHYRVKA